MLCESERLACMPVSSRRCYDNLKQRQILSTKQYNKTIESQNLSNHKFVEQIETILRNLRFMFYYYSKYFGNIWRSDQQNGRKNF